MATEGDVEQYSPAFSFNPEPGTAATRAVAAGSGLNNSAIPYVCSGPAATSSTLNVLPLPNRLETDTVPPNS
jgi:hypothetical protein